MCCLRIRTGTVIFFLSLAIAPAASAQQETFVPPEYRAGRAIEPITIDGQLNEPAWFAAPSVGEFHFTWYQAGEQERTVAKLLWDDNNLYLAHICQDKHLAARHTERDGKIPEDDCFEIMVAPDPARPKFYFNLEWNVIGGLVDNHRPEGAEGARVAWNSEGVAIAGRYVGTPNDDSDQDRYWLVEVAIPLTNFAEAIDRARPVAGDVWHINLNRHGGDTNRQYSQWSPGDTPAPAFHTPHRFGRLIFSDQTYGY